MKAAEKIEHLEKSLIELHEKIGYGRAERNELSAQVERLKRELAEAKTSMDNYTRISAENYCLRGELEWLRSIVERVTGGSSE